MSLPNVQSTRFLSFYVSLIGTTHTHVAYCIKSLPSLTNSAMETSRCSQCLPMTCSVTTPNSLLQWSTRYWKIPDVALSRIYTAQTSEGSRRSSIWANSTSTALLARGLSSTRSGRSLLLGIVSGVYVKLYLGNVDMFSSQPKDILYHSFRVRLTCQMTFFAFDSYACCWTRVACVSIVGHRRESWTTGSYFSRYVLC
jgi:hypothetical protein